MLTPERQKMIMNLLEEKGIAKLQELVELTNSSESTIRRDLSQMEESNQLHRVHGGASLPKTTREELSIKEKASKFVDSKRAIAQYASSLIEEGDSIYLDAGTTVYEIIPFIKDKVITVVTNGLTHIDALLQTKAKLYILGGEVKVKTSALIGGTALKALEQFRFDKCFIGTNGIHDSLGYSTPDPDEAYVKQKAIEYSDQAFVLADASKFAQTTFSKFANIEDATIITDLDKPAILKPIKLKTIVKVVTKL